MGLGFLGLGLVVWQRRLSSRSGLLMVATGFAWFAGSLPVPRCSCTTGRWSPQAETLQVKLARAVGDPSLVVAYRLLDVDEAGQPVALPAPGASRTVTYLHQDGDQIGVLIHDAAVLDDPDQIDAGSAMPELGSLVYLRVRRVRRASGSGLAVSGRRQIRT